MKKNSCYFVYSILLVCCLSACNSKEQYEGWQHYKGTPENLHYSSLTQVDTGNVKQLQVAWEYHTGDADTINHSQMQCNPIMVDGVLYGTSPMLKLFAIDAQTGKEKWVFNPLDSISNKNKSLHFILNNNRGVTYWTDGDNDKRIYYTAGSQLFAVNAVDGKLVKGFGSNGSIDLHDGLGRDIKDLFITSTSPPAIYKDLLITGTRVDEGPQAAPGHIRAYDIRTGQQRWIFHTIPQPGEPGYETWDDPEAYKTIGGANAWSGFGLDVERGILFAATGSASYDFYGGKRTGDNLYANTLLALDAATGKRIWHFQVLHHDVWDRDLSSPPALVTINREGKKSDAVALTTKTGFIYVFDRANGKPLFDIIEKPVPNTSPLVGEKLSPTQPYPSKPAPFMRQLFTEQDINPFLPDTSIADIRKRLLSFSNDHMYNPITLQGTVIFPGLDGGAEWGGPSFDPGTGILYINSNEMPWELQAIDINKNEIAKETVAQAGLNLYQRTCMTCHGPDRKGSGDVPTIDNAHTKYSIQSLDALIQSGRRRMPAFKQLSNAERTAIAAYVLDNKKELVKPYVDTSSKKNDVFRLPYSIKGYNRFLSKEGYPAIAPPWGTLNAVNLNTGEYVWKIPLGHDSTVKGGPQTTGIENYGASVVTAGGLVFIAATRDGKFRAFNKRSGELLWEISLPVPAFATPAVYELNGKQYIVIACGGGKQEIKSGDSYIAYALP